MGRMTLPSVWFSGGIDRERNRQHDRLSERPTTFSLRVEHAMTQQGAGIVPDPELGVPRRSRARHRALDADGGVGCEGVVTEARANGRLHRALVGASLGAVAAGPGEPDARLFGARSAGSEDAVAGEQNCGSPPADPSYQAPRIMPGAPRKCEVAVAVLVARLK